MPALIKDGDMVDQLPANLRLLKLKFLTSSTNLSDKYVKAVVAEQRPLSSPDIPTLKLKLTDTDGVSVQFLAKGQIAEELDTISCGDTVICLKFICVRTPSNFKERYCIMADDTNSEKSLVWFSKTSSNVQDRSESVETRNKLTRKQDESVETRNKLTRKQDESVETRNKLTREPDESVETRNKLTRKQDESVETRNKLTRKQDESVETRNKLTREPDESVETRNKLTRKQDESAATRNKLTRKQDESVETRNKLTRKQDESVETRNKLTREPDESVETRNKLTRKQDESVETRNKLTGKQDESVETRNKLTRKQDESVETRNKLTRKLDESVETRNKLTGKQDESVETRNKLTRKQDESVETRNKLTRKQDESVETRNKLTRKQDESVETRNKLTIEPDESVETRNKLTRKQDESVETRNKLTREPDESVETRNKLTREPDESVETRNKLTREPDESVEVRNKLTREPDESVETRNKLTGKQDESVETRNKLTRKPDEPVETPLIHSKVQHKPIETRRLSRIQKNSEQDKSFAEGQDTSVAINYANVKDKAVDTSKVQDKIVQTRESLGQKSVATTTCCQSLNPRVMLVKTPSCHQSLKPRVKPVETPVRMKTPVYTYTTLSEVQVDTVVDIYGVVKFSKPPVKTRGLDYYVLLSVTDPSYTDPDDKLVCCLFHREIEQLPNAQEGDILRLHRVKIQLYSGKLQARNGPAFNWVLFKGSLDNRISSSTNYTFEQQDEEKFRQLKAWWDKISEIPTSTLSQLEPRRYFNTLVQVVRVCELTPRKCVLLRAWDGTLFTGHPVKQAKDEEMNESLREDVLLAQASEGLAVDIYVFDNHTKVAAQIETGAFVYFENLHAAIVQNQVEITLHGGDKFGRKILVLPPDDEQAVNLKAVLDPIVERAEITLQTRKRSRSPDEMLDDSAVPNKKPCHDQNSNNVGGSGASPVQLQGSSCRVNVHEVCLVSGSQEDTLRLTANSNTQPYSGSTQRLGQPNSNAGCSVCGTQDKFGLPMHTSTQSNAGAMANSLPSSPDLNLPNVNVGDSVPSSPSSYHTAPSPGECCDEGAEEGMPPNTRGKHLSLKRKQQNQGCQDEEPLSSLHVPDRCQHVSDRCQHVPDRCQHVSDRCQDETNDSRRSICPDTYTIHYVTSQDTNADTVKPSPADQVPSMSNGQFRCMQNLATVSVNHPHVPLSSLTEVLHKKLPYKFRIQAKVKSISQMPMCYHDLIYLYCSQCQRNENRLDWSPNETLVCRYCINQIPLTASLLLTFTLSDGRDTLSAHLLGENALQFFNCDSVMQVKDPKKFKQIKKSLKNLCPDNVPLDESPLIECCLLGYIKDGVAVYHIFDTILI